MKEPPPDFKLLWKQHQPVIISLTLLSVFYLLIRLPNLTLLPIFADEAIYIRWAQVMRAEPTLRFLPLTDGKQPLFMWLMIPFLKLISDPLIAGRLLSVLAGLGSLLGMFFLTHQLTKSQKHALIAAFLYAIIPYTFFFDRMALVDSLLTMFGIWALFFALRLIKHPQLDYSFLTGGAIGAAWLTKSPAVFYLGLLPVTILNSPLPLKKTKKSSRKKSSFLSPQRWYLIRLTFYWLITAVLALTIYNLLRLGPEFHQIAARNQDYLYPLNEILTNPSGYLIPHLVDTFEFFWKLLTPSIFLFTLIGIYLMTRNQLRASLFLLVWIFVPLLFQAQFARNLTARYFLYLIPPILIFASQGIFWALNLTKSPLWKGIIVIATVIPSQLFTWQLLTNPELAPLPRIERSGYLEEWTAGTGLRAVAQYLEQESHAQTIVVGTEGSFGTMPDGLQIYFDRNPRVTILGQTHHLTSVSDQLYQSLPQNKVYLLANDTRLGIDHPEAWGLQLIKQFPKAVRPNGTQEHLLLFELTHDPRQPSNP